MSGSSSDISRCISDTDTGIQVTACEAPPHPRPYCRGRVWRSFESDLGSRVFEAPFVGLVSRVCKEKLVGTFYNYKYCENHREVLLTPLLALYHCFPPLPLTRDTCWPAAAPLSCQTENIILSACHNFYGEHNSRNISIVGRPRLSSLVTSCPDPLFVMTEIIIKEQ